MRNALIGIILLVGLLVLTLWYIDEKAGTIYTNVIVKNSSPEDSVQVFITIQAPNSVVGMFGMTSDDTLNSCSQGSFYAYKDSSYNSNCTGVLDGLVVSFGGVSGPCAQTIAAGFPTGINIFECSINTAFESFDMSCEDGMNAMLKISVSDTVNWMYGDGPQIATFDTTRNVFPIRNNVNLPGIFPYLCTNCIDETDPIPQNCLNLVDSCSTYATCQTSRTYNNGGTITVEYLSAVPEICK